MDTRRNFMRKAAVGGIAGIVAAGVAPVYAKDTGTRKEVGVEEALAIHRKMLIIDGHNDTPVERVARKENPLKWDQRDPSYHTDIPKMKEGGYVGGFFIVGNGPTANVWITLERTMQQVALRPKDLMYVHTSKDMVRAGESGRIGIMMSIEGAARWVDGKPELVGIFHRLGVRAIGITHGEGGTEPTMLQGTKSPYGPCTSADREKERKDAGGLTSFGMEILKESNRLGIITDLSHINDKAFFEVVERSELPPVMSHTAVFSECPHYRCLTDDQIRALAAKGGVLGIAFAPMFIDPDPAKATVDRVVDHICRAADIGGIDCVGIGTDYDGLGTTVPVVPDVSQLPTLTRAMMARGLLEKDIRKVWGGNFLRVFKSCLDKPVPKNG